MSANLAASPNAFQNSTSTDQSASDQTAAAMPRALYHIVGVADPGLLPRLVDPVAKLGYTPTRLYVSREDGDGSVVNVDLRLACVSMVDASRVEGALRSVVGVQQVIAVYEGGASGS